jgi:UTP-glucose-1-phosphate uridylyltransferase
MGTIRKAVFPVAGLGTRFLPATKASPKEMLPVVDKPLIQYAACAKPVAGDEPFAVLLADDLTRGRPGSGGAGGGGL